MRRQWAPRLISTMNNRKKVICILPAYNEAGKIGRVVRKVLATGDSTGQDSVSGGTGEHVGLRGVSSTDLRPAGKGDFDGRVLDVTAANGYIEEGKAIVVLGEDGVRILVEEE